jgi:hypothetical protein
LLFRASSALVEGSPVLLVYCLLISQNGILTISRTSVCRMKEFPSTRAQYLRAVARETARMSYPGRMGGIVRIGTKRAVEDFFVETFPLELISRHSSQIAGNFEEWHSAQVRKLAQYLEHQKLIKGRQNRCDAVAAKFLNTYMFQLMKYEFCRPLRKHLHLPLDRRILKALASLRRQTKSRALSTVRDIFDRPPYAMNPQEYERVQQALLNFIHELNHRPRCNVKVKSRIELNLLWAE